VIIRTSTTLVIIGGGLVQNNGVTDLVKNNNWGLKYSALKKIHISAQASLRKIGNYF